MTLDPDAKIGTEVEHFFVAQIQLTGEFVNSDFCWHVVEITSRKRTRYKGSEAIDHPSGHLGVTHPNVKMKLYLNVFGLFSPIHASAERGASAAAVNRSRSAPVAPGSRRRRKARARLLASIAASRHVTAVFAQSHAPRPGPERLCSTAPASLTKSRISLR